MSGKPSKTEVILVAVIALLGIEKHKLIRAYNNPFIRFVWGDKIKEQAENIDGVISLANELLDEE